MRAGEAARHPAFQPKCDILVGMIWLGAGMNIVS